MFFTQRNRRGVILATGLALALARCAGGYAFLRFENFPEPISMSGFIHDAEGGELLIAGRDLELVEHIAVTDRTWATLYGLIDINDEPDLGARLRERMLAVRGDGLLNLTVTSSHCGWNMIEVLAIIPLWPGCVDVLVEADVYRRRK